VKEFPLLLNIIALKNPQANQKEENLAVTKD